ncbi:MAG TPA: autotransporter assembly complex family protein [Gammaproteobacteria bacterium]|nr:autotransporter assembly complex family protein [Gammaproteobacteria bacterium]
MRHRIRAGWCIALWLLVAATAARADTVDVKIEGISGDMLQNARGYVSLVQASNGRVSAARIRSLFALGPRQIKQSLQPYGYYQVRVSSRLTHKDRHWTARYEVQPGEPARVGAVDIVLNGAGAQDSHLQAARKAFPLQPGDQLDHRKYQSGKSRLLQRAYDRGYLDAHYTRSRLVVDVPERRARVELTLDTGPRYRFGKLRLHQNVLTPRLVRAFAKFKPGDYYNNSELLNFQYALDDSEYFSHVRVQPRRKEAHDRRVPIDVYLEGRPPQKYTVGLGYGTDTGPRLTLGFENRRINRYGHRASANLLLSPVIKSLQGRYLIPIYNPATDNLAFGFGVERDTPQDRESLIRTLSVSENRTFGMWQRTYKLSYQRENYRLAGGPEQQSTLVLPELYVIYTDADNPIYTRRGVRATLDIRGADRRLGSDNTFLQVDLTTKAIVPVGPRGRLILRGEGGTSYVQQFSNLPLSERFFAGGDRSVRGYGYQSLGPRNASGTVVGGRNIVTGSVEYDHRIIGNWGAAVFYDAGNAFDGTQLNLAKAAGVGLRWNTPVGPLRIDLAHTIGYRSPHYRLHVTLGPDL